MTGYYKKNNNKGANTYGEARRGKGQNQSRFVLGASTASISPLEIAREEDHLEEELGYRVPGLNNNGGAEGADAEDVQLGWLVNASAVRFSIRSIFFFFFFFFFVCVVFVSAIEMRKSSPRGKIQKFSNLYRKRADERKRLIFYHHSRTTTREREESAGLLIVSKLSSRFSCSSSSFTLFLFFFFVFSVVDIARTRIIATTS